MEDKKPNNQMNKPRTIGYVYCLTNPMMSGIIKIGMTKNPVTQRMYGLQTTGVPAPFVCAFAIKSINYKQIELFLHKFYNDDRINVLMKYKKKREFFKLDPENVRDVFKVICDLHNYVFIEDIDEYEQENNVHSQVIGEEEEEEEEEEDKEKLKEYINDRKKEYKSKNTIRLRTRGNLDNFITTRESGHWNISENRIKNRIRYVEIVNFRGTEKIVADYDKSRWRKEIPEGDEKIKTVVTFKNPRKVKCNIRWVGMACINYVTKDETVEDISEEDET